MAVINGDQNPANVNDTLSGTATADSIYGLTGNDTIYGQDGDDLLQGGVGNDTIFGDAGNDTIQGGLGQDNLNGGSGYDKVDYTTFNGGGTFDLKNGSANLGVFTETVLNFEHITTGSGDDTIYGPDGNQSGDIFGILYTNILEGGAGNDTIYGGTGDDFIVGGFGQDTLNGGAGSDRVDYRTFNGDAIYNLETGSANLLGIFSETMLNFEDIFAGGGNDVITGTSGNNSLFGGAGNDTIFGGAGSDKLFGDAGDDTIQGGAGQDSLYGDAGNDTVDYTTFNGGGNYNLATGVANLPGAFQETMDGFENIKTGNGDDVITGTTGDNKIYGGAGNDTILAVDGNDYVQGGLGLDYLDGGMGVDTVDYTTFNGGGTYNLGLGSANLGVFTETMLNFESILTGGGNDEIYSFNRQGGFIDGGAGNDTIVFGSNVGTYVINGGDGNDTIKTDGYSNSIVSGGNGNDFFGFEFTYPLFCAITDFTKGEDKIRLFNGIQGTLNNINGTLDPSNFQIVLNNADVESSAAKIVYNLNSGSIYYNPTSSVNDARPFATTTNLVGVSSLLASDFIVGNPPLA